MSECHPKRLLSLFPTNSCHQQVVTTGDLKKKRSSGSSLFPINRCHQRVVTVGDYELSEDELGHVSNQ